MVKMRHTSFGDFSVNIPSSDPSIKLCWPSISEFCELGFALRPVAVSPVAAFVVSAERWTETERRRFEKWGRMPTRAVPGNCLLVGV